MHAIHMTCQNIFLFKDLIKAGSNIRRVCQENLYTLIDKTKKY